MKKTSRVLKQEAKDALKGNWKDAILLNLIPNLFKILTIWATIALIAFITLFAAVVVDQSSTNSGQSSVSQGMSIDELLEDVDGNDTGMTINSADVSDNIVSGPSITSWIFSLVIAFIMLGVSFTLLDMLRQPKRKINPLKDAFRVFNGKDFIPVFLIGLLQRIFITLWTMLLIIPGIIKSYAYSQSFYIYKDLSSGNDVQEISSLNYITESRKVMDGNKGRLFYIDLSFIGWHILALITLGLGYLVLNPYIETTKAAFYRDVTKDKYLPLTAEQVVVN